MKTVSQCKDIVELIIGLENYQVHKGVTGVY